MSEFIKRHLFTMISLAVTALLFFSGLERKLAIQAERTDARILDLTRRMADMARSFELSVAEHARRIDIIERSGSAAARERLQLMESRNDFAERRVTALEGEFKQRVNALELEFKQLGLSLSDIRGDLRLLVDWMREEKESKRRASNPQNNPSR